MKFNITCLTKFNTYINACLQPRLMFFYSFLIRIIRTCLQKKKLKKINKDQDNIRVRRLKTYENVSVFSN